MKVICFVLCFSMGMGAFGSVESNVPPPGNLVNTGNARKEVKEKSWFLLADRNTAQALENAGISLLGEGRYGKAIENFNRALDLSPGTFLSYWGRGAAWYFLSESELAIEDLDRAIKADPDRPSAYWFRGLTMKSLGMDGWEKELRKAVKMFREQGDMENADNLEKMINDYNVGEATEP